MDFRKYSVDRIPRQTHQTGLQGRLGWGRGGGRRGNVQATSLSRGPGCRPLGSTLHPCTHLYQPSLGPTSRPAATKCHRRLRSPNPATRLCLQGSQQSNDLSIPSSRPCGLCKRARTPCPSSWCSSHHSFRDPFSSWAPQVTCKDLTCMRTLTLLPRVTLSVTQRFKPHSLLSFHWTVSSQTSGRLFLPRDPLPTLRTRPCLELVLPNRR